MSLSTSASAIRSRSVGQRRSGDSPGQQPRPELQLGEPYRVSAESEGTADIEALVACLQLDSDASNNSARTSVTIEPAATVTVSPTTTSGGGCVAGNSRFDPLLFMLLATLAAAKLGRRD